MSLIEEIKNAISPKFTREVLLEVLKNKFDCEDIVIKKIDYKEKTSKGDAYLSTLCRFAVEASGRNQEGNVIPIFLPVIAKSIPTNEARRKTFRSSDFFQTEIYFYQRVWPKMKKIKMKKFPDYEGDDEIPVMLCCYSDGVNDYIVFEDLTYKGYDTTERGEGVDFKHATLFLKLLAHFHALGIACRLQDPEFESIAQSIKETYFDEKFRPWYERFMNNNLVEMYRHAVSKFLPPMYLDRLNQLFATDLFGTLCAHTKIVSKFSTITQGDSWTPNFLVKYKERTNEPEKAILLDFQLTRYTTLTNDLINFLYACISQDLLMNKFEILIEEYHHFLSQRLSLLGCDKNYITLMELKEDIKNNGIFGVGMALETACMSMLQDDEVAELDGLKGDEPVPLEVVWDMKPFEDDARNKRLATLIKHAVDHNFI